MIFLSVKASKTELVLYTTQNNNISSAER